MAVIQSSIDYPAFPRWANLRKCDYQILSVFMTELSGSTWGSIISEISMKESQN